MQVARIGAKFSPRSLRIDAHPRETSSPPVSAEQATSGPGQSLIQVRCGSTPLVSGIGRARIDPSRSTPGTGPPDTDREARAMTYVYPTNPRGPVVCLLCVPTIFLSTLRHHPHPGV